MNNCIWFNKQLSVENLQLTNQDTMAAFLEMEWVEIGPDYLSIKMPVTNKSRQPYGILHGGASCALAETAGSVGSHLLINPATHICVGLEINANHIRSVKEGFITATAKPLHIGATTHVWDIQINNEAGKLVCASRLTVAILPKRD